MAEGEGEGKSVRRVELERSNETRRKVHSPMTVRPVLAISDKHCITFCAMKASSPEVGCRKEGDVSDSKAKSMDGRWKTDLVYYKNAGIVDELNSKTETSLLSSRDTCETGNGNEDEDASAAVERS